MSTRKYIVSTRYVSLLLSLKCSYTLTPSGDSGPVQFLKLTSLVMAFFLAGRFILMVVIPSSVVTNKELNPDVLPEGFAAVSAVELSPSASIRDTTKSQYCCLASSCRSHIFWFTFEIGSSERNNKKQLWQIFFFHLHHCYLWNGTQRFPCFPFGLVYKVHHSRFGGVAGTLSGLKETQS